MQIEVLNTDLTIRPSSIDDFYACGYKWGLTFLNGIRSATNNRAAIGTGIHKGIETYWQEAMRSGNKGDDVDLLIESAVKEYSEVVLLEKDKGQFEYEEGENLTTSVNEIKLGSAAWLDDIAPFTEIPTGVEKYFEIQIAQHPIVTALGGTIDYLRQGVIADVKTSKRKPTISSYVTQQSTYKYLAEANGEKVKRNEIQSIVLKKAPDGAVYELEPKVDHVRNSVNNILDVLDVVAEDKINPNLLLRGNPKHFLCSKKWCAHYSTCPFVAGLQVGTLKDEKQANEVISQIKI